MRKKHRGEKREGEKKEEFGGRRKTDEGEKGMWFGEKERRR